MIRFLVISMILVIVDYGILYFLDSYSIKYFIITHLIFIIANANLLILFNYLNNNKEEYIGLGIMASLIFKMLLTLGIFIVIYDKLQLNKVQIINFLLVYFGYTIVFLENILKRQKK